MLLNKKAYIYIYIYILTISIKVLSYPSFLNKLTQNKFSQKASSALKYSWNNKYIKYGTLATLLLLGGYKSIKAYKANKFIKNYENSKASNENIEYLKTLSTNKILKIKNGYQKQQDKDLKGYVDDYINKQTNDKFPSKEKGERISMGNIISYNYMPIKK
jgi:hypothetical protein